MSQDNENVKPTRSSMLYDYYKMIGRSDIEDNDNNTCVTAVIAENDIAIITVSLLLFASVELKIANL